VYRQCHEIRNATCSIAGVMLNIRKSGTMTKDQYSAVIAQLMRIEKSLNFVRQMNIGNNG
jgi:hypothetical protein